MSRSTIAIMLSFILALAAASFVAVARADDLPPDSPCQAFAPYGLPVMKDGHSDTLACRTGYLSAVNSATQQPDWVIWRLTPARAMGCTARTNPFHHDSALPAEFTATPGDYAKSGYDLGHLSPYEDNAVTPEMGRDSFDVPTNFSPQLPKLNRLEWEQLESDTRAWTMTLGDLIVMDGPIYAYPVKTIGAHKIAVPTAFWKVVIAVKTGQAFAFTMTNDDHPKGPIVPYLVAIADIEREAGLSLPLPAGTDKLHVVMPPPADTAAFAKAKKTACAHSN